MTWEKIVTKEYDFFKIEEVPIFAIFCIIPIGGLFFLIQLLRDIHARLRPASAPKDFGAATAKVDL